MAPRPVSPDSPQPKKRSHRCFVCGGIGQHRLNFRYCPQTWQLVSERLAKFNSDERLVSYDGSPLPMTRNPGGVAAHLFFLHRSPAHSNLVTPHSIHPIAPSSNRSFESNPRHVPSRSAVPTSHVSDPGRTFITNPPHVVPSSSRTIPHHFPTPFSSSPPVSAPRPIPKSSSQPKSRDRFILELFDCLIDSSSFRRDLLEVIGIVNSKSTSIGADPLGWWKIWEPVRDRIAAFATY
ncbi:hypothetical protein B0H13DRAFT_2405108 [Mycena leptocephala]|nr:hypothetical protein B0H13DRAFT_2405108 [Mycena leptocephala]